MGQNLRVSWKQRRPSDCISQELYRKFMRTILQEKEVIHRLIAIWYTNLFLCLKQCRFLQLEQQWSKSNNPEMNDEAKNKGREDTFRIVDGHLSSE